MKRFTICILFLFAFCSTFEKKWRIKHEEALQKAADTCNIQEEELPFIDIIHCDFIELESEPTARQDKLKDKYLNETHECPVSKPELHSFIYTYGCACGLIQCSSGERYAKKRAVISNCITGMQVARGRMVDDGSLDHYYSEEGLRYCCEQQEDNKREVNDYFKQKKITRD